jgi:selenocysteine lyase/cysteine desulfurase
LRVVGGDRSSRPRYEEARKPVEAVSRAHQNVYADNNATTPVAPEVYEAVSRAHQNVYADNNATTRVAPEVHEAVSRADENDLRR